MKILIVENEFYLAQSIQNNLIDKLQAKCDISSSYNEAINIDADVYIINSNLQGNLEKFIEEKKDKIIILIAPYVTHTTVTNPINLGADDYLQKPFSIEDLIRKINHLTEFYKYKTLNEQYKKFIDYILEDIEIKKEPKIYLPLFIKTNNKKLADKVIFNYAIKNELNLVIVKSKLPKVMNKNTLYYIQNFNEDNLEKLQNYQSIILVDDKFDKVYPGFHVITLKDEKKDIFQNKDILSIEDYIKYVILSYQHSFPDTELSKKLGISRKSLWEKRRKYGIFKEK